MALPTRNIPERIATSCMAIDYQGLVTQGLASQIADQIRAAIPAGRLKVDERLPTEAELAARWGVSRPTIREALGAYVRDLGQQYAQAQAARAAIALARPVARPAARRRRA
jgi:DNA-binding transcriptional MocR family regulator